MEKNSSKKIRRNRVVRNVVLSLLVLIALSLIGITIFINDYYKSKHSIGEYANDSNFIITEANDIIKITTSELTTAKLPESHSDYDSNSSSRKVGVIMYQGGKVEYTSYIPLMENIAKAGYEVFIPHLRANLAILDINAADKVIKDNSDIKAWFIIGHSLGGACCTSYLEDTDYKFNGVILLGAYPMKDLSDNNIPMLSIVGTKDNIINREKYEHGKKLAPKNSTYLELKGANHAGYGDYGEQDGDGQADITPEEQREETAKTIIDFISDNMPADIYD